MKENYAFYYGLFDGYLSFDDIKSQYGLYLREVNDSAAVSWDVATSKNPYINGVQVNNRTANPREITILFGYTGDKEPYDADNLLFEFLAPALNGKKLIIEKERNYQYKYIDGVIKSVNHIVFTDEPTLEIVLLTDSFWRIDGENAHVEKRGSGVNYYFFVDDEVKGNIDPDELIMELSIVDNNQAATLNCNFGPLNFTYDFPVIPSAGLTKQIIELKTGKSEELNVLSYNGDELVEKKSILSTISSGIFPVIKAGDDLKMTVNLWDMSHMVAPSKSNTLTVTYDPLFIR